METPKLAFMIQNKQENKHHSQKSNQNIGRDRGQKRGIFFGALALILVYIIFCFMVYQGSQPTTYPLKVNDVSGFDIDAPRTIINQKETENLAREAMAAIPGKMVKNEETTAASLANIESFISLVDERRDRLYTGEKDNGATGSTTNPTVKNNSDLTTTMPSESPTNKTYRNPTDDEIATTATSMVSQINQSFNINFSIEYAKDLLSVSADRYNFFVENLRMSSDMIMDKALDAQQLKQEIENSINGLSENQVYFLSDLEIIDYLLSNLLMPNVDYDQEATQNAREAAATRIRNNPILINQGTRIVSQGDVITEDLYDILEELNLTDTNQFDWPKFIGISILNLVLFLFVIYFFRQFNPNFSLSSQSMWAIIVSLIIPLVISYYAAKTFPLSPPIYFTAIIICAYFDFRTSLVLSTALAIAIYPMTSFNPYFLPVVLVGCLIAAVFARRIIRQDNYAKLILITTLSSIVVVLSLNIMREVTFSNFLTNAVSVLISSMVSVIVAIGVMPLFELIFNTVTPMKIIELSQPGQPLMKKLFSEAPGTSQHSMMVANLADAGCEAIGADANLVRVGAYYHDIGKLENPIMFTENQSDYNPHDFLTPEQSCQIVTAHTEDGLKMGRKYRLPEPVLKMIHEHHGTTILQFFYHKACQIAEQEGREQPDPDQYRYHNPLPSFRESAVLMLADSVEAAMKSAEIDNIEDAEKFMRNIVKIKIDQNQLIHSGLSFHDVELIINAFIQVYAGQFHKRIKYPEPAPVEAVK